MKAFPVDIYKNSSSDCTNKGASSSSDRALVIHDKGWIDINKDGSSDLNLPVFVLTFSGDKAVVRPFGSMKRWPMFGGNFLWSSDSRFRNFISEHPLAIFDRIEE